MSEQTDIILVVDDEPSDLDAMRNCLESLRFQVLTAGDGASAIRIYEEIMQPIRLLVADVAMAPMNGCDLALSIARVQEDLKVLFVSGYTGAEVLRREGMMGLNAEFLRKPFTDEQLAAAVRKMLKSSDREVNARKQK